YSLEVSSPGIKRPLKKPADFIRFAGQVTAVKTKDPINGRKRFKGIGRGLDEEGRLALELTDLKETVHIDLDLIDEAKLDPEITF
ncbi:ribosome maturation factor RimP, partial [bacterium]